MANSNFNLNLGVLSSVQVLFCSLIFFNVVLLFTHATSINDDIATICPNTTNPSFCKNTLNSAGISDLKELANYTLNLAHSSADKSLTLAKSLAETNPQIKEKFLSCSEDYNDAIEDIENAQNYLAVGDFNGVNLATSGVMTTIDDCQENIKDQSSVDTLTLMNNDQTLNDICSIILVISNLLPKPT